jgi:dTMP kinase
MDSDPAASVARARRRNRARIATDAGEADENRFERESRAFFDRVHNAYLAIARREAHRFFMVDARRTPEVVHQEIVAAVRDRFKLAARTA